jgi:hypothetical protein
MSLTIAAVTFDCRDAAALAEFWSALLERPVDLGAKRLGDFDEGGFEWATLADPEGNLFDIAKDE